MSSVEWALLRLGRFGRSRIVRRRVLGVGSRFFAGLWLLLLLPLLLDIRCGAFEMARGIGSVGGVKTLLTSEALQTTPSRLTGVVISASVSFLEVAGQ